MASAVVRDADAERLEHVGGDADVADGGHVARCVDGVDPMIAATMCLVMAFFEPATRTSPRRGPDGSTAQAEASVMERVYGRPPANFVGGSGVC